MKRFMVSGPAQEDGPKPSLPMRMRTVRRKQQASESATEGPAEEPAKDVPSDGIPEVSRKTSKRKTVMDFLKGRGGGSKNVDGGFKMPVRSMTQKAGVSKPNTNKRNSGIVSAPSNEEFLERLMGPPKPEPRQASDNFFLKQCIRASSRQASSIRPSPFSGRSQAEFDRKHLSEDEITLMFAGAPLFSVEWKKSNLRPQVLFRGGEFENLMSRGTDHQELGHNSFAACSLSMHSTQEIGNGSRSKTGVSSLDRTGSIFLEVPSMLSANGIDKGTIGFEHFLQLPIADSTTSNGDSNLSEKRQLLHSDPEELGLRDFDVEQLVDRLTGLSELYSSLFDALASASLLTEEKISELGEDLFGSVLDADLGTTPAGTGSVSLSTQINALQKVLDTSGLWHDFGVVEWRIRVGQLLWATPDLEGSGGDEDDEPSERDVLLLQIGLAAELLVRLKLMQALPASGSTFPPIITELDREAIRQSRSTKVEWDLLLAERFLENLSISAKMPDPKKALNRSSILSAVSYMTAKEDPADAEVRPMLFPRHAEEQMGGLMAFSEALVWPHTADVRSQLQSQPAATQNERPISMMSIYATPLSSPTLESTPGTRSSYLGGWIKQEQERPGLIRKTTAQSMQLLPASSFRPNPDGFEVGGWLSRSWLSGLVLPGEAASHFLISTLLENSPAAINTLGDCANLYGGFAYSGRTFWSKSCVVGRVLAATPGASECMGWISVPGAPTDQADGWLNVSIKDCPCLPSQARIKEFEEVANASSPLHGTASTTAQAGDFTSPTDGPPVMGNEARSQGLSFSPSTPMPSSPELNESLATSDTSIAFLTFSSPINSKLASLRVPLTYDIYFVSSYPCYPSPAPPRKPSTNSTPKSPHTEPTDSIRPLESTTSVDNDLPLTPAHPLHIDYHFNVVPAATLLSATPPEARFEAPSLPNERPPTVEGFLEEEIVMLDCRGNADLELLARAWCAKVGENALIGKEGRTCISCCIREARALNLGVVIRI